MDEFTGETVCEARKNYADKVWGGCVCSVCDRYGKINPCIMNINFAKIVESAYEYFKKNKDKKWVHSTSSCFDLVKGGELGKLRHWGLLMSKSGRKDDGNPNNGFWTITQKGKDFVDGKVYVIKKLYLYNKKIVKYGEKYVGFDQALGKKFRYNEDVLERSKPYRNYKSGEQLKLL